jgi:hypothetical protein
LAPEIRFDLVDSRAAATRSAVQSSHAMYVVLAASRGRSANVQVYDVDLTTNSCGTTCRARGLRSGFDGFEPGAFIGFYTGRWGARKSLGGANAYMLDAGDDDHHVAPPGARCRRVDFGLHAMAAINEPSPGVCMPRPARRAAPTVRAHTRACAVVRWLQEVANAFFKRQSRRTCPSLHKDAVAIAVHAAVYIPPFTPILIHYGGEYSRSYDVGEKCHELPLHQCQRPCDAMPWPTWRLPADAFV